MHSLSIRRLSRLPAAVLAAALTVAGGAALGSSPARAATDTATPDIALSLNPASGTNYATDMGTLSWTVPSSCVAQAGQPAPLLAAFLYQGTAPWDLTTMNMALGDTNQSGYFGDFYLSPPSGETSASGSTSWPNVTSGYQDFLGGLTYASTSAYVNAYGAGVWTVGAVCANSDGTVMLDSSGNPVAGSFLLNMNADGSWGIDNASGTSIALSGHGTVSPLPDKAWLTATVTAADGSTPVGAVNFYAGATATGTPLNGSTPVPVGRNGKARYSGPTGYFGTGGPQEYTVAFVPADSTKYTPSALTTSLALVDEDLTIRVKAVQDPSSPGTVDLRAHVVGYPTTNLNDVLVYNAQFLIDGTAGASIPLNSLGVAATQVTGVALGSHTISAQALGTEDGQVVVGLAQGDHVTVHPVTVNVLPTLTGPKPTITGIAKIGKTLTAHAGTWQPSGVALAYQWYAGGTAIAGATNATYKIASSLFGETIKVKVTGTLAGYATLTKTSAPTSPVAG